MGFPNVLETASSCLALPGPFPEKINRLSNHTFDFFESKWEWLKKEVESYKSIGKEAPQIFISALTMKDSVDMIVTDRKHGFEVIFHQAPIVRHFYGREDCQNQFSVWGWNEKCNNSQ